MGIENSAWSQAVNLHRRGRPTARTGTVGHPNFERGIESVPSPETAGAHTTHIERPDRAGLRGARAESPVWRLARVPAGQSLPGRGQSAHPGRVTATQAEKHVAKELNVSPEDVDEAVQEAACEVS